MSFFDLFKQPDVNRGVEEYQSTSGAVLLDVRTPEEYRGGHIPGSRNIPLQTIDNVSTVVDNKDTALYVYCQSGARSRGAKADGLYECEQYRRHRRLCRKGGTII